MLTSVVWQVAVAILGFVALAASLALLVRYLGRRSSRLLSEEAAQEILATMADGLLVCDAAGQIEIVNEALCSMTGLPRRVLVGTPLEMLFRRTGEETFAGSRWKEETVHEELTRLFPAAGDAIDVSVSISQLYNDDGALQGAVVLVRDIRESRRAQLRLAESEARLAEAQRLARCGHWRWAPGGDALTGSDELFRIFEVGHGEPGPGRVVPWRRLLRRLAREDRRALLRTVSEALRDREGRFQLEARLAGDGERRFVHLRGEVGTDQRDAPVLSGTAQDVTEQREAAEAMRALGKAVETTQVGITIADLDGTILYANPAEAELHGYRVDELVGADVSLLAPPELRQRLGPDDLRKARRLRRETVNLHRDGRQFPVELTSDVLTDAAGEPVGVVTSCLDITERKRTEARFENLLESSPDPLVIVDGEGIIRLVNGRVEQELGYERRELLGQPVEILLPERQRAVHPRLRAQYLADPVARPMGAGLELFCRRKDGSEIPVDVSLSPAHEGDGLLVIAAIRDISERKKLERELVKHAFYDIVTGLPNRALLMDRLRLATRRVRDQESPPFALLCVGLDRFDTVIASLGPEAGDALLKTCAERLEAHALASDTVARVGGDVFVVLVERLDGIADATRFADRLLRQLGRPIRIGGREVFVGASIGVVLAGAAYEKGDDVLRDAETAMHRARDRRGPGRYEVFDEAMHDQAVRRLELETELRLALTRQELVLEYQPIVSVATGQIRGAEALLRWRHPRHGLLSPATLLPLAEETGLIFDIGDWALEAACRQNLSWQRAGLGPLFVAVNLSASQFRQRELPALVRSVLQDTGLEPERLELELTETVLMEDTGLAIDTLKALAATGVGLCVDDFGVGHSSLSYLQHFPMSTLKIDQSFIRQVGSEGRADSLTASIIGLAHNLGLKAIAEGVESERQLAALQMQSCDEFQGHYFSPSVPGEAFAQLVTADG